MILHEEPAEYDNWIRLLFLIPVGVVVGAIFLAYSQEYEGFLVLLGDSAFLTLLFYFIMPRKYQIYQDKLRIVLGKPFGINIPLSTIKEVKHTSGAKAFVYTGVRFATSSRNALEIVRNKGLNYIISPRNGDMFIERLGEAIESYARNRY
jgi:hypothetical protein